MHKDTSRRRRVGPLAVQVARDCFFASVMVQGFNEYHETLNSTPSLGRVQAFPKTAASMNMAMMQMMPSRHA